MGLASLLENTMKRNIVLFVLSCILIILTVLTGCQSAGANKIYVLPKATVDYLEALGITDYQIKNIADYQDKKLKLKDVTISSAEVQERVDDILESYAYMEPVTDRAVVQEGDFVHISYVEKREDTVVREVSGDVLKVGAGYYNEEIEKALVGRIVGQPFWISVEWEDEDGEAYRADCDITIMDIQHYVTFSLKDDDIKETLGFEKEEDYRKRLKQELLEEKKAEERISSTEKLYQELAEKSEITLKQEEVVAYAKQYVEQHEQLAYAYNLSLEDYCEQILEMNTDEFYDKCYEDAKEDIEKQILIGVIADQEGITISKKEIEDYQEKVEDAEDFYVVQYLLKDKEVEQLFQ